MPRFGSLGSVSLSPLLTWELWRQARPKSTSTPVRALPFSWAFTTAACWMWLSQTQQAVKDLTRGPLKWPLIISLPAWRSDFITMKVQKPRFMEQVRKLISCNVNCELCLLSRVEHSTFWCIISHHAENISGLWLKLVIVEVCPSVTAWLSQINGIWGLR